jgi:DNA modification methylase
LVSSFTQGTILDPFTGSGTTAIACIRTGRRFIGCELSEEYCEIAAKRCDRELDQGKLFTAPPPKAVQRSLMGDGA